MASLKALAGRSRPGFRSCRRSRPSGCTATVRPSSANARRWPCFRVMGLWWQLNGNPEYVSRPGSLLTARLSGRPTTPHLRSTDAHRTGYGREPASDLPFLPAIIPVVPQRAPGRRDHRWALGPRRSGTSPTSRHWPLPAVFAETRRRSALFGVDGGGMWGTVERSGGGWRREVRARVSRHSPAAAGRERPAVPAR